MKIDKGQRGYINSQKKYQFLMLLLFIAIGVAIFVIGFILNKGTKTNLFTVLAILMVLPAAKRVVSLVLLIPAKPTSAENLAKIDETVSENATVFVDYLFTSPERVMHLDCLVVEEGNVIGIVSDKKQRLNYINTYLSKGVHNLAPEYRIKIYDKYDTFLSKYKKRTVLEVGAEQDKVVDYLRSLAV